MFNKFAFGIFFGVTIFLLGFILFSVKIQPAGDIVEYFGVTESIINHKGISLSSEDEKNLSKILHPEYFSDPGYYIEGKNGNRYPVHFIFYSFLVLPVRLVLMLFKLDPLKSLALTNVLILTITTFIVFLKFVVSPFKKLVFLSAFYFSPVLSFIIWPGPDLFYLSLLVLAVFSFYNKKFLLAALLVSFASWHSQPLVIMALAFLGYYFFSQSKFYFEESIRYLTVRLRPLFISCIIIVLIFVPYFYNYFLFGALTPWTMFQNGWTEMNGFGLQNISLQKFFEQYLDLNFGLFWYAPFILLTGLYLLVKSVRISRKDLFVFFVLILSSFIYQTNPAWHYGTSGFGPTRHIIFIIPFLVFYIVRYLKFSKLSLLILAIIVSTQLFALSLNNFISPNFENTLNHSIYAKFILNNYPQFYNPTPEIFIDRTNHTDLDYITTAIYTYNGKCKKAYVVKSEIDILKKRCGFIPEEYEKKLMSTDGKKANYSRTIYTKEATFWPDPESCGEYFIPSKENPFVCMQTLDDVIKNTKVEDKNRFTTLEDYPYPGIWKLKWGNLVKVTVPPGYIIDYYSLDGDYINY